MRARWELFAPFWVAATASGRQSRRGPRGCGAHGGGRGGGGGDGEESGGGSLCARAELVAAFAAVLRRASRADLELCAGTVSPLVQAHWHLLTDHAQSPALLRRTLAREAGVLVASSGVLSLLDNASCGATQPELDFSHALTPAGFLVHLEGSLAAADHGQGEDSEPLPLSPSSSSSSPASAAGCVLAAMGSLARGVDVGGPGGRALLVWVVLRLVKVREGRMRWCAQMQDALQGSPLVYSVRSGEACHALLQPQHEHQFAPFHSPPPHSLRRFGPSRTTRGRRTLTASLSLFPRGPRRRWRPSCWPRTTSRATTKYVCCCCSCAGASVASSSRRRSLGAPRSWSPCPTYCGARCRGW